MWDALIGIATDRSGWAAFGLVVLLFHLSLNRGWIITRGEHNRTCALYEKTLDERDRQVRILTNGGGHDVAEVVATNVAPRATHGTRGQSPPPRRQGGRRTGP